MSLPIVTEGTVSLIQPIVIPDLFLNHGDLKPEYSFLGSLDEYSQYYLDLEQSSRTKIKFHEPVEIPEIGFLCPLKRKHSCNSYWRYFRLPIERAKWEGSRIPRELFLLLPLVLDIPINPIKVNKTSWKAKVTAYLFSFGPCILNIDVKISSPVNLSDIIKMVPNLKRTNSIEPTTATGKPKNMNFRNLSRQIVTQITKSLFGNERPISVYPLHTFLFVRKVKHSTTLSEYYDPHRRAIAAAITGQNFHNVLALINVDDCFSATLKKIRPQEILMFNPAGSFIYASPNWQDPDLSLEPDERLKLRLKADCMRKNYECFLNFLFATNRFLQMCCKGKQASVPKNKLQELKKAFSIAFLDHPEQIYFGHAYEKIAPIIGLDTALKEL